MTGPTGLSIRQIAYFCADVRASAAAHSATYGSGPYFVADHIPLLRASWRGADAELDHSSAYGQWGDVMVEFVQQNNPGPSAFHDIYPEGSGRHGIHHVAVFADDPEDLAADLAEKGFPTAFRGEMMDGFVFLFVDTTALYGHMLELYRPVESLTGFYDFVRKAAIGWAGEDPIRTINLSGDSN